MKLSEVIRRDVKTVRTRDNLHTAARLMWDHDCGALPVLGDDSRVVAMLTDRDICMAAYTQGKSLWEIEVRTAMSKELFFCSIHDTVVNAENLMWTRETSTISRRRS